MLTLKRRLAVFNFIIIFISFFCFFCFFSITESKALTAACDNGIIIVNGIIIIVNIIVNGINHHHHLYHRHFFIITTTPITNKIRNLTFLNFGVLIYVRHYAVLT